MSKTISFWCPFIGNVGTVKAVLQSAKALSQSNKYKCKIINVFGEFDEYKNFFKENNIEEVILLKSRIINLLPNKGFFWSRLNFILIFLLSFFPFLYYLRNNRKDYLFIYLITSLPLLITKIFNLDNKIVFRVSGKINFSILRKFIFKFCKNKIFKILVQTTHSRKIILKQKIFKSSYVHLIYDPVIDLKKINKLKKEKIENKYLEKKYFISIGRLSYQKNFIFLIKCVKKIIKFEKNYFFLILGQGEEKEKIQNYIKKKKLSNYIKLAGYKRNVYKYIHNSSGLICTSLWEEPGFIIQEAASCKKIILTSNCFSGPEEFLDYGKNGYTFQNNNGESFIENFKKMLKEKRRYNAKIKKNFKKVKLYSLKQFSADLSKIL
jgi:glycosyltransferase involved in cell wall biosynthesis